MYNSNPRKIKLQAVFVGHVIDSITFLVSRPRKVKPPPTLKEVLSLESQLWDMRYELAVPSFWKMSKSQLVSVILWREVDKRGRISEIHSDLNLVNVLLVDTGEVLKDIDVESRIRELPVSFVGTPALAL
ncbi:hypothetical protein TCAL_14292 [Tigriopus californicus]|uniref:Uncharacterized protein n=1 Tax=Tigriopus californicus TaxID=6832 RepID=A0A553NEP9_TIGCA|nr:hypothetical protein TCAL_14292 [Tigriopus californicus]